ncbi:MAG: hypothetical protein ACKVQS_11785 [Fimbriimonadaceae bacterium]
MSTAGKVAEVTAAFWVMKICATTLGETGGDYFAQTLNMGYDTATIGFLALFLIALFFQMRSKEFKPWIYWLVIVATSTAGTTMSDYVDRTLHIGYEAGSLIIASLLVVVLIVWKRVIGSLSVDHISGGKVEGFYWTAILVSNTLGTALGDYLADSSGLGFAGSAALISGLLVVILLLHFYSKVNKVWLFWFAFVLTRPFGATFGDLMTKPLDHGGLNLGTLGTSLVLLAALGAVISWNYHLRKAPVVAES